MSKLKENIDRILGSSLRCLLPSYWWKRIFGLLVDEIDDVRSTANSKATKSEVASLSYSVNTLSDRVDRNIITVDSELSLGSTNPVQNKVVTNALNNKQTTLVSGSNIKTINNQSILGSGDLKIDTLGAIVSRDLYAVGLKYGQTGGVITELTSELKDYNKVTKQLFLEGKADVRIVYVRDGIVETFPVWHYFNYYDSFYFVEPFDHVSSSTRLQMEIHRVRVEDDGTATWERYRIAPDKEVIADSYNAVSGKAVKAYVDGKIAEIPVVTVDSELSDTSENPVQNKVIKAYVDELNARLKTLEEQLKTVI